MVFSTIFIIESLKCKTATGCAPALHDKNRIAKDWEIKKFFIGWVVNFALIVEFKRPLSSRSTLKHEIFFNPPLPNLNFHLLIQKWQEITLHLISTTFLLHSEIKVWFSTIIIYRKLIIKQPNHFHWFCFSFFIERQPNSFRF